MGQPPTVAPAGWYPDPDDESQLGYWDGERWLDIESEAPTAPPRDSRTLILVIVAGVLIVVGLVAAFFRADDYNSSNASSTTTTSPTRTTTTTTTTTAVPLPIPKPRPPVAPAGTAVQDGGLQFEVVDEKRAKTVSDSTNSPYLTATADGEFVVVTLKVTNVSQRPRNYFSQNQRLFDSADHPYTASIDSDVFMNAGDGNPMGAIAPGESMRVRIAFDLPVQAQPAVLELHESATSDGIGIRLD
ncbi:MAG: DUF4352 domain-containing protein [Mycobacterium sp.]|jgi:hypothetical protein|nr:DUF4352 domain-containing protein [Mycobacterium sp.]